VQVYDIEYGRVATAHESRGELRTLFSEVEEYFACGATVARGATVVDVGANIGAFAVAVAKRCVGDVHLLCFEPVPPLFHVLERNLRDNDWLSTGVHSAYNLALSTPAEAGVPGDFYYFRRFPRDSTMDLERKRREFEVFLSAQGTRAARAVSWLGPGARLIEHTLETLPQGRLGRFISDRVTGLQRLRVPRSTLSRALGEQDWPRVDLLKIDVEGAELKVLAGIDAATWDRIGQVVIESDGSEEQTRALTALVVARGLDQIRCLSSPSMAKRGFQNVLLHFSRG
jgi:FkbM family methyltransferase